MLSTNLLTIAICLGFMSGNTHAMWKFPSVKQKKTPITQAQRLLEKDDLKGFLKHTVDCGINPNEIVTDNDQTALTLACAQDTTGEIVKQLLAQGHINMHTRDKSNGIWKPLSCAIDAKNWGIVEILLTWQNLPLTEADITYAYAALPLDL